MYTRQCISRRQYVFKRFVVAPYDSATEDVPEEEIYAMQEDKHHELLTIGSVSLFGEVDKQSGIILMIRIAVLGMHPVG